MMKPTVVYWLKNKQAGIRNIKQMPNFDYYFLELTEEKFYLTLYN